MKKITVLGGGTGSYLVLTALKQLPLDLAAVVTMIDSGGSTGRLRDQLGVLPPGDLRQCLVALSDAPALWRKLFTYRFEQGDFKGHSFGNIMISALEKVCGDYSEVLDELHHLMKCSGRVHPAALTNANIQVRYDTGRMVESETLLDDINPDNGRIVHAALVPLTQANAQGVQRLYESDYILAGPGDLYSSIISISLVDGMRDAVMHTSAKFVYVMNLMTKSSQTLRYTAANHLKDIRTYFGRYPDFCIIHSGIIEASLIKNYAAHDEEQVHDDIDTLTDFTGHILRADILDTQIYKDTTQSLAATHAHSVIRHDSVKLQTILKQLFLP